MSFGHRILLPICLFLAAFGFAESQTRTRQNFYGMHNLKDGGAAIPEGMNWTRHLVGEGGYVFDWVRGDYGRWVVDAMDRGLIPCLRLQNCNGGCDPDAGYPAIVVSEIRSHLAEHRPAYLNRLIYVQLWNEPGDPRDFVAPERFADFLVAAHSAVKRADASEVVRTMTPGQNGPDWWRRAIRHNPAVCQAFDVWATHPYPESYPPHYNHHDSVPFINQVKTIDSYLLDLDAVAMECEAQGSPRRGFPVMVTETIYGDRLGISYEGYPKTQRGAACSTDGPCENDLPSQYNVAAFTQFWHRWPEITAVHPFLLQNWSWDPFAFVSRGSRSRADKPVPAWCPHEDIAASTPWPPGYSEGAKRCGLPDSPYPQYKAILDVPKPPPAPLEPYRGPVGSIRGLVKRKDTGSPVKFATLFTDGYEFGGPTLSDGIYAVHDVPAGTYTLGVNKVGYESATKPVVVEAGKETVVDFDLEYRGQVSKGIYFQNQGTCSNCNLFAPFLGESFTVPDDVGFIQFAAAMPNVGSVTMKFSILKDGPEGPPVGPPVTAYLEWGGEMIGAEWPGDGVPVEPGGTYFLKVERADGQGVYLYATDSNPYPGGMAFTGTTAHPGWDLFATIRGATVAVDTRLGTLAGSVHDETNAPLAGASVVASPGAHFATTSSAGDFALSLSEGTYDVTASLDGYVSATESVTVLEGQTSVVDLTLERNPLPPPPPTSLITNGDFASGLAGWSLWVERGTLAPSVDASGRAHVAATGHNGGIYQSFPTGGAGRTIEVEGFWASGPTVASAQWAEVLVINGARTPADGQDLNANQPDVVLLYKNDTWATRAGWSGPMSATSPVHSVGSFIAAGDVATIVLKSGNLLGVTSGTYFDDIVVRGEAPPLPSNRPPEARAAASPLSGNVPLAVSFDGSGSSDPDGDTLSFNWSFGDGSQGTGAQISHTFTAAGTYTTTLAVTDGRGGTASTTIAIDATAAPPPAGLLVNGDFSRRLEGWSLWRERGSLNPVVENGQLRLAAVGHNGGVYQQFSTGGAGLEISIEGFWATNPTVGGAQWAEVLVINGGRRPVDGQDLNSSQADVVLLYKNDTWASTSGWSGSMRATSPVVSRGSFVTAGDVATIVLKSGNLLGVNSGTTYDDVVVTAASAPPPLAGSGWDPRLTTLGLELAEAAVPAGTWYWKLESARFESDGEILPPPGGGSESGGTHSIYVRALNPDGSPIENQGAVVSWPEDSATVRTKSAADDFWGDFPMSGGWCPYFPEGPRGPYAARIADNASDDVRGMGLPCNRHVSYRLAWKWSRKPTEGSKLSIHAGFGGPLSIEFVRDAKPGILKILDSFSAAREVKQISPDTKIIGRAFLSQQPMDGDPVQRAREWWDRTKSLILQYPEIDYWEGYNEPVIQTDELMRWYAAHEKERVLLLAENGRKGCIGNFSVGNPDLPLWPSFYEAIDAAIASGGILGLHEYGTPMQQLFDEASGEGWLAGRYRKVYRQFLIPENKVIPLAVTETGVDIVAPVGWKNHFTEEEYLAQLQWYDGLLRQDDYVLGATIFALEIPGWFSFDIAPIVDELAAYVAASR